MEDLFPIRGFSLLELQTIPRDDHDVLNFRVQDKRGPLSVILRVPKPGEDGVYEIEGTTKVLVKEGRRGSDYPLNPNKSKSIWVRNEAEIIRELVRDALDTALVSAVKGNPPAEQAGQDTIDSFFATSPLVRDVDSDKPLDLELTRDVVHIDISGDSLNVEDRRIHDWPGIVDPLTTPQGPRALQTFRLAGGATIKDGRFIRGDQIMSDTMRRNLVFPENDLPSRLLITRSALAKHEELVYAEDPLVRHHEYREGDLRGIHLFTAIMADRTNYSDCITVSMSAAQKLCCYRRLNQSIIETHPVHLKVSLGSDVKPDDVVAEIEEGLDKKGKPRVRQITTRRLVSDAKVVEIKHTDTHLLGEPAERVKIRYEGVYMLSEGDKLTTRHGTKGVIRIVPDHQMPEIKTQKGWVRAEILVHPFSIAKRRAYGLFREMMANRLAMKKNESIATEHFDDAYSMRQLVGMKLGGKRKARIGGRQLDYSVYAGPAYWIRLDMHAKEQLAHMGSHKPLNFVGLNPDAGKVSGQRLNLGAATIMHAKGLEAVHQALHARNVEGGAIQLIQDLMGVLAYTGQAKRAIPN